MKHGIFTVLDTAVGAFLPPFYSRAKGEAIRSFTEAALDPNRFGKWQRDYVLYQLGEFDDTSGMFSTGEPMRIMSAAECAVPDGFAGAAPSGARTNGSAKDSV